MKRSSCASGQRIGPLLLDRILRGQHEERIRQRIVAPAHRHFALLHRFEHGGLGFGRGPVDFVRQNHVRENGPFQEPELARVGGRILVDDFRARDIAGH